MLWGIFQQKGRKWHAGERGLCMSQVRPEKGVKSTRVTLWGGGDRREHRGGSGGGAVKCR